jgi:hypothetical protein
LASNEDFSVEAFVDTEKKLVDFINQAVEEDHDALKTDAAVEQVKVKLSLLTARVFSKREWPDTIWPIGHIKLTLATLFKSYNKWRNSRAGLRVNLKGGVNVQCRSGA